MDLDSASLALAQRLQAEEDMRWNQAQRPNNIPAGEALLLRDRDSPQQRQLLVASANQVVYDVRSSGRFILLAVSYGILELVSGCVILGLTYHSTCDTPLKIWLLIFLLRYCVVFPQELARYIAHSRRHDELMFNVQNLDKVRGSFSFIWTIMGLLWTLGSPSAECRDTSPVLWYFCTTLILMHIALACSPLILLAMFCMCLPCLLLLLRFFQPHEGMSNADVRKLPESTFNSSNIQGSQSEACVICQNDFINGDRLRHLPCGHEFHSACLDQWLILKATCPLCRVHVDGRADDLNSDPSSPV